MPKVYFGKKEEGSFELQESPNLIAVRTRSGRSLRRGGPVLSAAAAEVEDGELVMQFPQAGVEVFRVPVSRVRSLDTRKTALRRDQDVRFAGGVLVHESGDPLVYTENVFIKFKEDVDPSDAEATLRAAGLTVKYPVGYATNGFFVGAPEGSGQRVFDTAESLIARDDVEYCHPELLTRREFKAIAPQQWHLQTSTLNGITIAASANVAAAHSLTEGSGITIAVIDDGFDIDHQEFRSAGKVVAPRDASLLTDDPRPKDPDPRFPEDHGTACAGVACADGVAGASGVAPKAKLMPIRCSEGLGSQKEADAFRWAADQGADVISCSWGPPDGRWFQPNDPLHNRVFGLPASTRLAMEYATNQGRGGKGCVILFAAGNGNESVDNDGYASFERVIAVAACNDRGQRSVYSDFGKAIWCAFPSGDSEWPAKGHPKPLTTGIWTTDRRGAAGYNSGRVADGDAAGNYTNSFSGTSSACPGAAGVAALVLARNPALRWQEVREILRQSCDKIDPAGGNYDATGRSPKYGYGRLNAERAVILAAPASSPLAKIERTYNQRIPDLQKTEVSLEVADGTPIQSLAISLDLDHSYIGDLRVTLIPPTALGAPDLVLHDRQGGATRQIRRTYTAIDLPALAQLAGKSVQGTWTLRIEDLEAQDEGLLKSLALTLNF